MGVLLGIDIGTSSVKSMIMDLAGNVLGFAQLEYQIDIPSTGYAEQDPAVWWELVCQTSTQAMRHANVSGESVSGVGFSGQMHGLVVLDKDGNVLRPAIIWCDQRSIRQKEKLKALFSPEALGNMIQNSVSTGFQLLSLMWVRDNEPEIYDKIWRVILPKDYIRYRLTGEIGGDSTDASSTSAYNVAARKWSEPLLAQIGIDPALFPSVGDPWQVCGEVTLKAAIETKLTKGTPVVFGGADQAMQAVGNGIIHPGIGSCTIGTGGQLFTPIARPIYDRHLRTHTYIHAVPNQWYLMGATMSAGLSLKWLATQILNSHDYRALDEKAKQIQAGSNRLLFLPYLTGDRTPHMDPFSKGIFFGLSLNHHSGHLVRAVLEGVCYSLRDSLEIFTTMGVDLKRIIVSGGGARSELWKQILADILDRDVYTSTMQEQACVGAAIMAGVGVQMYDSVEQACSLIVKINEIPIRPTEENRKVYSHHYSIYQKLYECNRDLFALLEVQEDERGAVQL